jgi:diguanylate cyclase
VKSWTAPARAGGWRAAASELALGGAGWALLAVDLVVVASRSPDPWRALLVSVPTRFEAMQSIILGVLFVLMLARLVLSSVRMPRRARSNGLLAASMLMWTAGSMVMQAAGPAKVAFPAPQEWLFVASVVLLAAYLFFDAPGLRHTSSSMILDSVVVACGSSCLVGVMVAGPFAEPFLRQGVPLLVALLYPIMDSLLLAALLGQMVAGARDLNARTFTLLAGMTLMLLADTALVRALSTGTYDYGAINEVAWVSSYALMVAAASATPREAERIPVRPRARTWVGGATVGAAGVAVAVLAFQPPGQTRDLLISPAVLTLVTSGVRLGLALRQAKRAADAYRLTLIDELTEIPNRRALVEEVERVLRHGPAGLILLDLSSFKEINDTLGHVCGDSVLGVVATRLCRIGGPVLMSARLGSDEFAVLVEGGDEQTMAEVALQLRSAVQKSVRIDGIELSLDCSMGLVIGMLPLTAGDLLRRADVAMHQAKSLGDVAVFYDPERDEFSRERLRLGEELRSGIGSGEIVLWYQPKVDALTGSVVGVEALVRWQHPRDGLMQPASFLPVARRSGLMPALTDSVVRSAVADLVRWRQAGLPLRVAINVAPAELLGGHAVATLISSLERAGLEGEAVVVEVTEDSFLAEPERARQAILELRRNQIDVSIDDFGTGYSSLSYLRDLPVQELKIDRSFVARLADDHRTLMIVSTTVHLAHGLGLRVVAEGVEDEALAEQLRSLGVDVLQGYLYGRPMPAEGIAAWIHQRQPARSS